MRSDYKLCSQELTIENSLTFFIHLYIPAVFWLRKFQSCFVGLLRNKAVFWETRLRVFELNTLHFLSGEKGAAPQERNCMSHRVIVLYTYWKGSLLDSADTMSSDKLKNWEFTLNLILGQLKNVLGSLAPRWDNYCWRVKGLKVHPSSSERALQNSS